MTSEPASQLDPSAASEKPPAFPILRASATLLAGTMLLAGTSTGLLWLLQQTALSQVNFIAAVVCGLSGVIGFLPVWLLSRQHRHGAAQGFLIGMLLRMVICAAAVFTLQWAGYEHAKIAVFFFAGWYLLTLIFEVKLVSSFLLAHAVKPSAPEPATSDSLETRTMSPQDPPASGVRLEGEL